MLAKASCLNVRLNERCLNACLFAAAAGKSVLRVRSNRPLVNDEDVGRCVRASFIRPYVSPAISRDLPRSPAISRDPLRDLCGLSRPRMPSRDPPRASGEALLTRVRACVTHENPSTLLFQWVGWEGPQQTHVGGGAKAWRLPGGRRTRWVDLGEWRRHKTRAIGYPRATPGCGSSVRSFVRSCVKAQAC